jgi:UDP-GlcNAc:undecaprenyl-phosphate GlcNAc-1-phosphate transferase
MSGALFFSFVGSLILCMALIPPLVATAGRFHFIDLPGDRKIHEGPVAKIGGIALAAGTFTALLLWVPKDEVVVAALLGGAIILLFGAWDDRAGLSYRMKFFGQLLAAGAVILVGGVRLTGLPLWPDLVLPGWVSVPLTMLVLVGVTNAINLADGLDGLAGGLSLLSFAGVAYLAYLSDDTVVTAMMASVLGGLLGFLRFNTYPARIFMGDAGSQFLGFYLAVSSIVLTDPARGPYSPALAPLVLGVPLLDTLAVMIQRIRDGRSPFVADQNHIHHKLLAVGLSHREAVILIYSLQAGMVSLAYLLRWQSDGTVLALYGVLAAGILTLFFNAGRGTLRLIRKPDPERSPWLRLSCPGNRSWPADAAVRALSVAVPLLLAFSVLLIRRVPDDMAYGAAALFVAILAGLVVVPRAAPLLVRSGLYVGSAFVMYLGEQASLDVEGNLRVPFNLLFMLLALLVMLAIRFSAGRPFETTPLDYLMVLLALIIPVLPEMRVGDINLSVLTAKLIVLFFSFELLLHHGAVRIARLGLVSLWMLFWVGLRAWW